MARVRDVMTMEKDIPKVSTETSVLDATNIMNAKRTSAVAVVNAKRGVVGVFGERTLLTEFVSLNKRPDEVKVGEVMHALYKIKPDATTREAAKEIVDSGTTRLGVYDGGGKFIGWVTLTDLSRHFSRETLVDRLRSHNAPETTEVRCPNCRKDFMEKVTDHEGRIVRWQCPNCGFAL